MTTGRAQPEKVLAAKLHKLPVAKLHKLPVLTHRTLRSAMPNKWTSPQVVVPMAHTCCHPLEELDQSKPSTQQKQAEPNRLFLSPHSIRDLGSPTPGSCVCEGFGYQIEGLADNWQGGPKARRPRVPEIRQTNQSQAHPSWEETQTPRTEQSAGAASTATAHKALCATALMHNRPQNRQHQILSATPRSLSPVPCLRHQSRVFTWC